MKKLILLILVVVLIPKILYAVDNYTLLEPLPCIEGTGNNCSAGETTTPTMNLETYIGYIFKFAIAISAFLAIIMIIYGGFEIMLSEAVPAKMDGKERIKNAIFGLIMVLASYLILRTIDPRLVEINTRLKPIDIKTPDVIDMQKEMQIDLSNYAAEAQRRIDSLNQENQVKNARITELEGYGANRTDDENVELERLKGEVTANRVNIHSTVAKETGSLSYQRAANIIASKQMTDQDLSSLKQYYDPTITTVQYGNERDSSGKLLVNTSNVLINQYNDQINSVAVSDPEKAQMLIKQKTFYINEIVDQYELSQKINSHKTYGNDPDGLSPLIDNTTDLKSRLAKYEGKMNNQELLKLEEGRGISQNEYKEILASKIRQVNDALNK